jgi:hypothetical protein
MLIVRGRVIAQAVSHLLPNAAAWVRAQVRSSGIYGGKSGTGAGFLRVHRFPLPISSDCSTLIIIYDPGLVQQASYEVVVDSVSPHLKEKSKKETVLIVG